MTYLIHLQEVSLDGSSSSRESFLSRVKEYNRVLHPRLRKLEAVFFDKVSQSFKCNSLQMVGKTCYNKYVGWGDNNSRV